MPFTRFIHRHPVIRCPRCGLECNAATALDDEKERGPRDGDLTICATCKVPLVFAEGMTRLVVATQEILASLPLEVRQALEHSREELLSAPNKLICQRAIEMHHEVPGTRYDLTCSECGDRVGVAPSGQRVLEEHKGNTTIICNRCYVPARDHDPGVAPGAIDEMIATRGGKPRGNA